MLSGVQRSLLLLAASFIVPALAFASSIEVDGVCEAGSCPLPTDSLAPGSSIPSTNFNFTITINGDTYDIFGSYSAYNTSNSPSGSVGLALTATAVYEGTAPTTQDDMILFEDLQNNTVPHSFNMSGMYQESMTASFVGPLATYTSLRGRPFLNGDGLGKLGVFSGPGSQTVTAPFSLTGTILDEDFQVVFDFGKGTQSQSSMTAVVSGSTVAAPEPAGIIPVVTILILGLGIPAVRRYRAGSGIENREMVSQ